MKGCAGFWVGMSAGLLAGAAVGMMSPYGRDPMKTQVGRASTNWVSLWITPWTTSFPTCAEGNAEGPPLRASLFRRIFDFSKEIEKRS